MNELIYEIDKKIEELQKSIDNEECDRLQKEISCLWKKLKNNI